MPPRIGFSEKIDNRTLESDRQPWVFVGRVLLQQVLAGQAGVCALLQPDEELALV